MAWVILRVLVSGAGAGRPQLQPDPSDQIDCPGAWAIILLMCVGSATWMLGMFTGLSRLRSIPARGVVSAVWSSLGSDFRAGAVLQHCADPECAAVAQQGTRNSRLPGRGLLVIFVMLF
jgi:hypothetical protein